MKTTLRNSVELAAVTLLLVSCSGNTSDENDDAIKEDISSSTDTDNASIEVEKPTIGRFVYMDRTGCLHLKQDCNSFSDNDQLVLSTETNDESVESSLDIKSSRYALHRIPVKVKLKEADLDYCCNSCINDSIFNLLAQIALSNDGNKSANKVDYNKYRVPRPARKSLDI